LANWITLSRFPLLVLVLILFYTHSVVLRWLSVGLLLILILMDTIDGLVARARHETSLLGSVLDIAADRAVEIVLWVVFADLNLIPLAIPIVVIIRGTVVDALRSAGASQGQTPFSITSSKWGQRIVASPPMRTGYGIAKGVAFCSLAALHALSIYGGGALSDLLVHRFYVFANIMSWIAVALCVVRAIPVFAEAPAWMRHQRGPGLGEAGRTRTQRQS